MANWWNWILNSFGQWHSWAETSIDANEADIAALQALPEIHAFGTVSSATAAIDYNGRNLTGISESGGDLIVDMGVTFASADQMVPIVTVISLTGEYHAAIQKTDTNTFEIHARSDPGEEDLGSLSLTFSVMVLGTLA